MFSLWRLLCCLPLQSSISHDKKSNVSTLRELLVCLDSANEEDQKTINRFLQQILANLNEERDASPHAGHRCGSLVNRQSWTRYMSAVRRHIQNETISQGNFRTDSNGPRATPAHLGNIEPPSNDLSIEEETDHRRQLLSHLFNKLTSDQLEMLLQFDAVRTWASGTDHRSCEAFRPLDLPPVLPPVCSVERGGTLRLASWNLNRFTLAKANHPGFREVVCLTILRANVGLVMLQEVSSLDVASVLCAELNSPSLPRVRRWCSQNPASYCSIGFWDVATSAQSTGAMFRGQEYALFLYNTRAGIRITRTCLLEPKNLARSSKVFSRSPCSALCHIRSHRFVLVSVHLKSRGLRNSMIDRTAAEVEVLDSIVQAFYDTQPGSSHLIIAGDFNLNPEHEAFSSLRNRGFKSVLSDSQSTSVSTVNSARSSLSSSPTLSPSCAHQTAYDNAWISPGLLRPPDNTEEIGAFYFSSSGVLTGDLQHVLIPDDTGAGSNGFVSDHCPIWFDLQIP